MRVVVQRVSRASVEVDGRVIGSIDRGLVCLVGVTHRDTTAEAHALSVKVAGLRVFADERGMMNQSVLDVDGSVLVVSQFTLYGDVRRGRRPSFTEAADATHAEPLVEAFRAGLEAAGVQVVSGVFGAMMAVSLVNEGPVTLVVEASDGRVA